MVSQKDIESGVHSEALTIPEPEQSKAAVLNTLASIHSRRSYEFAIDRFIAGIAANPDRHLTARLLSAIDRT